MRDDPVHAGDSPDHQLRDARSTVRPRLCTQRRPSGRSALHVVEFVWPRRAECMPGHGKIPRVLNLMLTYTDQSQIERKTKVAKYASLGGLGIMLPGLVIALGGLAN